MMDRRQNAFFEQKQIRYIWGSISSEWAFEKHKNRHIVFQITTPDSGEFKL